jgi:hypothetical protein
MSLTTPELLKVIDQLKDYVAIAKQRNDIINDDKPYPIEKRIELLRVNNQANDSMQKIIDHLINVIEEEDRYWNQQADLEKEQSNEFKK